jgi:hypothetical protein
MRYHVSVSVEYVSGAYPADARESLAAEVARHLTAHHLAVTVRGTTVVIDAEIRGGNELTSPLDALSRLDAGVLRALAVTGQFEEFDVVRRSISARAGGADKPAQ